MLARQGMLPSAMSIRLGCHKNEIEEEQYVSKTRNGKIPSA